MSQQPPPPPGQFQQPSQYPPQYPPGGYPYDPQYQPPKKSSSWVVWIVLAAVGVVLIPMCIGILLPALGAARRAARRIENSNNMMGISKYILVDATASGKLVGEGTGMTTLERFQTLCAKSSNPLDPRLLVNPLGSLPYAGPRLNSQNLHLLTRDHVDYAMLSSDSLYWTDSTRADVPFLSDKQLNGQDASYWSPGGPWEGHIGWGDAHVDWNVGPEVEVAWSWTSMPRTPVNIFAAGTVDRMENP